MKEFEETKTLMMQLEAKVTRLEAKIEHQALLMNNLHSVFPPAFKLVKEAVKTAPKLVEKSIIPRTCQDARANNPSLSSGMYWVDPDGNNVGDDAIYVFCNMETGNLIPKLF